MGWISAGADLIGGLLNKSSADKNIKLQKQFAKNAIQWKVNDAKAAGIHPLYALGANTVSFQPVSVGGGLGDALSSMGQNVDRALEAGQSRGEQALSRQLSQLQVERAGLENVLLRKQIASVPVPGGPEVVSGQPVASGMTPEVTLPGGFKLPGIATSSAQTLEDAIGEIADWLKGAETVNRGGAPYMMHLAKSAMGQYQAELLDLVREWKRRVAIGRGRMQSWR